MPCHWRILERLVFSVGCFYCYIPILHLRIVPIRYGLTWTNRPQTPHAEGDSRALVSKAHEGNFTLCLKDTDGPVESTGVALAELDRDSRHCSRPALRSAGPRRAGKALKGSYPAARIDAPPEKLTPAGVRRQRTLSHRMAAQTPCGVALLSCWSGEVPCAKHLPCGEHRACRREVSGRRSSRAGFRPGSDGRRSCRRRCSRARAWPS